MKVYRSARHRQRTRVEHTPCPPREPVSTGPNVAQATARHRFSDHFRDTPSALRGIVSGSCQRRSHDPKKGPGSMTHAMTALWSSPERRSERCPACADERPFEQPPCLDGHEPGECPEWACLDCGHAITLG